MATFASIVKGNDLAPYRREVELLGGLVAQVAYRLLSGEEEAEAIAYGLKYAKDKGFPDDEEIRELGRMAKRVALSFVDPDPGQEAVSYFTGPDQVLGDPRVGKERTVYLCELQELWQDQCCPSRIKMGDLEFHIALQKIAGSDAPDPFVDLQPGLRWSFTRTTARLLLDYLRLSASSGTSSAVKASETTPPSPTQGSEAP